MSLIRLLNKANLKIVSLSTKDRALLYLLPILIVGFVYYLWENRVRQSSIKTFSSKPLYEINQNSKWLMNFLENNAGFSKEEKFVFEKLSIVGKRIMVSATLSLEQVVKYIFFVESYDKVTLIKKLSLYQQSAEKKVKLELEIDFKYVWNKQLHAPLPLILPLNQKKAKNAVNIAPILNAVVGEHVLLNNQWLKKGEQYLEFTVGKITPYEVMLHKGKEKISIKLKGFQHAL